MNALVAIPAHIRTVADRVEGATPLEASRAVATRTQADLDAMLAEFYGARRDGTPTWCERRHIRQKLHDLRQARRVHYRIWLEYCIELDARRRIAA